MEPRQDSPPASAGQPPPLDANAWGTGFAAGALPPPREPFWGYNDLLVFLGIAPVALVLGALLVRGVFAVFRYTPAVEAVELLPEQLLGYLFLFAALAAVFRLWHGRPFWASLGWKAPRLPAPLIVAAGIATALGVAFGSELMHVTEKPNPLTDLMKGRLALILMAIFGVTVAPVAEELAFRGFLQPLLARSLGAPLGIVLTAIPFGALHYSEYADWGHVALVALAGAAFGTMRQATGSTRASALMHAAYNALFFVAAFTAGKDFR
jgi:uncharacterized protein